MRVCFPSLNRFLLKIRHNCNILPRYVVSSLITVCCLCLFENLHLRMDGLPTANQLYLLGTNNLNLNLLSLSFLHKRNTNYSIPHFQILKKNPSCSLHVRYGHFICYKFVRQSKPVIKVNWQQSGSCIICVVW